jgi:hypothetical protein
MEWCRRLGLALRIRQQHAHQSSAAISPHRHLNDLTYHSKAEQNE